MEKSPTPTPFPCNRSEAHPEAVCTFQVLNVPCKRSGLNGYTVRILPFHAEEAQRFLPGLIRWANEAAVLKKAAS